MPKTDPDDLSPANQVRSLLRGLGYRFRVRPADIPGQPDFALPKSRAAILILDCQQHPHDNCLDAAAMPGAPAAGPDAPSASARARQRVDDLGRAGWNAIVIRTCELRDFDRLEERLDIELSGDLIA